MESLTFSLYLLFFSLYQLFSLERNINIISKTALVASQTIHIHTSDIVIRGLQPACDPTDADGKRRR